MCRTTSTTEPSRGRRWRGGTVPSCRREERGERMTDERTARREDPPPSALPCVLTQPGPSEAGRDATTLAHNIATWHQWRALLTAYIQEHLQEGRDYYTLTLGGKVAKPSLSKAGWKNSCTCSRSTPASARMRKPGRCWGGLLASSAMSARCIPQTGRASAKGAAPGTWARRRTSTRPSRWRRSRPRLMRCSGWGRCRTRLRRI